jgi:hypothetical protein
MKRLGFLTVAASLGTVMFSSGPLLAFDGPPVFVYPSQSVTVCAQDEKHGYPNPGPDGCAYFNAGPAGYATVWVPAPLVTGRSVGVRTRR